MPEVGSGFVGFDDAVGIVKLIWANAGDAGLSVLPGDGLIASDFDHALVGLVSNQHIPVRQKGVLNGRVELVRAGAGYPKLAVLPGRSKP